MKNPYVAKLTIVGVLTSVIFFLSLTLTEAIPEIPVDIDFKPFFIPMAFAALVPKGCALWTVGIGAMFGEFLRDLLEGYEIDDPIGAVGYVIGFVAGGYIINDHPQNKFLLFIGATVAGFIHAAIEATAFLLFDTETFWVAIWATIGNTITDGIIMGAIPLILIMPRLQGRIERYLGFPPKGKQHRRRRNRQQAESSA